MHHKGQAFLPDFSASLALFTLFILLFGTIWNTATQTFIQEQDNLKKQGEYTFNLLKTTGTPANWEKTNITAPGLTKENQKISKEKFLKFKKLNTSKKLALLKTQEYALNLTYINNSQVKHKGEKLVDSSNTLPENKTIHTYTDTLLIHKTGKRAKLEYITWSK